MAVTAHFYPSVDQFAASKTLNLGTDTLKVLLIASGGNAYVFDNADQYVSDVLANSSGSGSLTEVSTSGTAYTRQSLTSVTLTTTALVTTLACANPTWATSTISSIGALFYDETASSGTDATRPALCYWDFGGTDASSSGTFQLQISGSGLITFTSAG